MVRRRLWLHTNHPTEITLLHDDPKTGSSSLGNYNLYIVKVGNEEFSFFADDIVHSKIKNLKKGDCALITKIVKKNGSKLVTNYDVVCKPRIKQQLGAAESKSEISDNSAAATSDSIDKYFNIMLDSYSDALKIQAELNGFVDVSRVAITLFIARSKMPYTN